MSTMKKESRARARTLESERKERERDRVYSRLYRETTHIYSCIKFEIEINIFFVV